MPVQGTIVDLTVPFEGKRDFFFMRPSTWDTAPRFGADARDDPDAQRAESTLSHEGLDSRNILLYDIVALISDFGGVGVAGYDDARQKLRTTSLSIYFYAGDFVEAFRRHAAGEEQTYATHNEVSQLIRDLVNDGVAVTIYSFITPSRDDVSPLPGLRFVSLGGKLYSDDELLLEALASDPSDAVVVHFPNESLLRAAIASGKRAMVVMASSYNRRGIKHWIKGKRLVRLLNNPRLEIVANHCPPATQLLAKMGVKPEKLVAWDIPHRFDPADFAPKTLNTASPWRIAYAGSISEDKGVGDLIRGLGRLHRSALPVVCHIAGGGDIDRMKALAEQEGVANAVTFLGKIPNGEVFSLFRGSDLVAVPSRPEFQEGFPLTLFEALASRTPIVCSDHPVFRPVLAERSAMFPAKDAPALAAAVRRALTDPVYYARLSREAIESWAALSGTKDIRQLISDWARKPSMREHPKSETTEEYTAAPQ